jgi:hypothetical protein
VHLEASGVEAFGDDLGGAVLLEAQFRMTMKIASEWNGASWSLTAGCTRRYAVDKIGPPGL